MEKLSVTFWGIVIIFIIYYVCLFFTQHINLFFPAPILGLFILFLLLKIQIIPANMVKDACNFILKIMILFFIPLFVGIIDYVNLISQNLIAILVTVFITTFLIMISVGLTYEYVLKYTRLEKMRGHKK